MSLAGIPQNVIAQTGNGQNFLTWNLLAGATSYDVQRSTDGITFASIGTATSNNYLDSTVTVGTNYFYQVASVSGAGTSPYASSSPISITPCLPGQINLGYMRYLAQLRADRLNSEMITLDEWNSMLNQSAFELYDILVTKFGDDYFLADPMTFQTTGAKNYPLPNGVLTFLDGNTQLPAIAPPLYKLVGVDCGVAVGNNAWLTLPKYNWIDRNKFVYPQLKANAVGVFNLSYRVMGNLLYFIPNPTAGQYIQLWYIPVLNQLLQDTDMLSFSISGWCEYIIVDTAMKALLKEESFESASAMATLKAGLLERIETTAANRDVGVPNTVSDTRLNTGTGNSGGFDGNGHGMGGW